MKKKSDKEKVFLDITNQYKEVIAKVCYLYAGPSAAFDDLYQEVLINLWQGLESFRGEAKISTWIYRMAINTCISWIRKNSRHTNETVSLDSILVEPSDNAEGAQKLQEYHMLYKLISGLGAMEKALITLWLDEKPYEEIARITGLSSTNVAVKIHRIKEKLSKIAADSGMKDN